jgi:hypothetical protein
MDRGGTDGRRNRLLLDDRAEGGGVPSKSDDWRETGGGWPAAIEGVLLPAMRRLAPVIGKRL